MGREMTATDWAERVRAGDDLTGEECFELAAFIDTLAAFAAEVAAALDYPLSTMEETTGAKYLDDDDHVWPPEDIAAMRAVYKKALALKRPRP